MRLKRLEVQGFKSFALQTEFGFEPGLTGIVGPNGCGKSNVVDAIKWVLGETRPTSLRGSEMQDVIFKGTATRAPLGYSEVTLVLDNSSQLIQGPVEVSLTRRLYRTGDGEYELNRQDVRRRDLKHLLAGTGLGVNAYSILEQGKIDAVLSANPVDRRAIFEEAAGITRFRTDRKEAIRRLESTEKDLESVRAVLNELERQRNSLRVQASRARKHAELGDQLRGWRAAAALSRFQERVAERDRWALELARLQELEADARAERTRAEEASKRARDEARNLAAEQARLTSELAALQSEEGRRSERARSAREHSTNLERSAEGKELRGGELLQEFGRIELEIVDAKANLDSVEAQRTRAQAEFEGAVLASREAQDRYREAGRALEEAQRTLLLAIEARTAAQNAMSDLEAEDRATRSQDDRLRRRIVELESEIARLDPEFKLLEARHSAAAAHLETLRSDEARIKTNRESASALYAETESKVIDTDKRLSALQSRLSTLRDLESSMAGVEAGAKAVLQAKLPGVVGLLADQIQTDLSYALALEAALGRYAGSVVVESRKEAADCLHFVRDAKSGRVSVIVVSPSNENGFEGACPEVGGIVGPLLNFVRCDERIRGAVVPLLRSMVLVETLADAQAAIEAYPAFTFITLLGERVDRSGLVGGQRETSATPIARRSTITALDAEVHTANSEQATLAQLRDDAEAKLKQARIDEEQWRSAIGIATREAAEAQVAFGQISHRSSRLQSERSLLGAEFSDLEMQRRGIDERRNDRVSALTISNENVQARSADVHELQVRKHQDEQKRDELAVVESSARVETARLNGEFERQRAELARRTDASERARSEASRLHHESKNERMRATQLAEDAKQLEASISELAGERTAMESKVIEMKQLGATQAEAAEEAVRVERERTAILEEVQSQLGSARLEHQRASIHCDEILHRAKEETNTALEELGSILTLSSDFNLEFADQRIGELRAKLEKLGSVSSDATIELDSIESRFADLDRQRSDLEMAKKTLSETIKELDDRCGIQFSAAFESIRKHFGELFRRLFRGGKADIILQIPEGADPLDAGVDIFAQPPGKKLQSISLLSGGERTLTALALLFAAFKTKPSPFCVLDEVDAALDDANVERFLNMLEEFKGSTQFIVVTHHRRTMAACSALLGVTMPERGVSQKVAVRLEDVDHVVPGAVGSVGSVGTRAQNTNDEPFVDAGDELPPIEVIPAASRVAEKVTEDNANNPEAGAAAVSAAGDVSNN